MTSVRSLLLVLLALPLAAQQKPNFLLLFGDDLTYTDIACAPGSRDG